MHRFVWIIIITQEKFPLEFECLMSWNNASVRCLADWSNVQKLMALLSGVLNSFGPESEEKLQSPLRTLSLIAIAWRLFHQTSTLQACTITWKLLNIHANDCFSTRHSNIYVGKSHKQWRKQQWRPGLIVPLICDRHLFRCFVLLWNSISIIERLSTAVQWWNVGLSSFMMNFKVNIKFISKTEVSDCSWISNFLITHISGWKKSQHNRTAVLDNR